MGDFVKMFIVKLNKISDIKMGGFVYKIFF